MKWTKTDCFGNKQVWYSEDVIERIKKIVIKHLYNNPKLEEILEVIKNENK